MLAELNPVHAGQLNVASSLVNIVPAEIAVNVLIGFFFFVPENHEGRWERKLFKRKDN